MLPRNIWLLSLVMVNGACQQDDSEEDVTPLEETVTLAGDYSCWKLQKAPDGQGPVEPITFDVQDPVSPKTVLEGLRFEAFPSNVVGPQGTGLEAFTNSEGEVTFNMVSNRWFAYRVTDERKNPTQFPTVGQNRMAVAGAVYIQSSMAKGNIDLIPFSLGRSRQPGTAMITGTFTDCAGQAGVGVKIRVFHNGEELISSKDSKGFVIAYFTSFLPSADEPATTQAGAGRFAVMNAPTDGVLRVEAWQYSKKTPRARVACEEAQVFPDTVSLLSFGPERSDYPEGSSCRR